MDCGSSPYAEVTKSSQTPQSTSQYLASTIQTPHKHLANTSQKTSQTPHKHLVNTSQTPHKHLVNTPQLKLHKHLTNTSQTSHKHLTNTSRKPQNTSQTTHKHLTKPRKEIIQPTLQHSTLDGLKAFKCNADTQAEFESLTCESPGASCDLKGDI